jgi:predicted ABC-type ATPase
MQPKAVIIAGANGAGKTTFASSILPDDHPECAFLNADEIQREEPRFSTPFAAGREFLRRLSVLVAQTQSFAIETTLSSRQYLREIPNWRSSGYTVWLYYLEVESAELSVQRVAQRVAAGGHSIPEADIRRRFVRSLALDPHYRAAVDAWYNFKVDAGGPTLVASKAP